MMVGRRAGGLNQEHILTRTFSSIFTNVSPSGKAVTAHLPSSMPMYSQIDLAKGGFEVPLKTFTLSLVPGFR